MNAGAQRLDLQELELQAVLLLGAGNRTWDAEKQEAAEPSFSFHLGQYGHGFMTTGHLQIYRVS